MNHRCHEEVVSKKNRKRKIKVFGFQKALKGMNERVEESLDRMFGEQKKSTRRWSARYFE